MKFKSKLLKSTLFIFIIINILSSNVFASELTPDPLAAGKQLIKQYYIRDIPDTTLDAAKDLTGLVKLLDDPYSAYFTEKQYSDFTNSINNTFTGIGVSIDVDPEGIKIVSVFDNTPAKAAGLMVGDVITDVDTHSLKAMSTEEAISYVKGVDGTTVNLKVNRNGSKLNFTVVRKAIVLPTVTGKLLDKHIGYIDISSFGENTAKEFKTTYDSLKSTSADSYIVDLRNNPGGYMNIAFDIAGYFIGDNTVLKSYPKTGQPTIYKATKQSEIIDKPVIFLTNAYSASASEILSAAVKDYGKVVFIGDKTYGKGVAQTIFQLPDKSFLKLTIFRFVSPLEKEINKIGISPDISIKDNLKTDVDALKTAEILLNAPTDSNGDNTGYAQITLAGKSYKIDLSFAESNANLNTFKYMATNLLNSNNISLGNKSGWTTLADNQSVSGYLFVAKPVNILPATGSVLDFKMLILLGILLVVGGVAVMVMPRRNVKNT